MRRAKIVCTLGPATSSPRRIRELVYAGMDVARLNMSHGSHEDHAEAYRLVREARAEGIPVTSLPGPSAPVVALTLSGLPNDRFLFAGFLPAKDKARSEVLEELASVRTTLVFFETAPRLAKSLQAIGEQLPGREVAVARELTKLYEECRTGTAEELAAHYEAHPPRGEIVLLIGPPGETEATAEDADALLREALGRLKPSHAAAEVARATGLDRKALYARALELK